MIDRVELKRRAKNDMSGNMGMLIVCLIIVGAMSVACNLIPYVGWIVSICITGPLSLGSAYIYLNLTRGFEPDVSILFSGFQRFVDTLVLTLLISIFTFLESAFYCAGNHQVDQLFSGVLYTGGTSGDDGQGGVG